MGSVIGGPLSASTGHHRLSGSLPAYGIMTRGDFGCRELADTCPSVQVAIVRGTYAAFERRGLHCEEPHKKLVRSSVRHQPVGCFNAVVVAMTNYRNFFGEGWQDRLAEMIREAITMMEQRIKKARAERPELADKTDHEIASILKGEDYLERRRRFETK